jgi:hypothetical protein
MAPLPDKLLVEGLNYLSMNAALADGIHGALWLPYNLCWANYPNTRRDATALR